jgi:hypothetical protein
MHLFEVSHQLSLTRAVDVTKRFMAAIRSVALAAAGIGTGSESRSSLSLSAAQAGKQAAGSARAGTRSTNGDTAQPEQRAGDDGDDSNTDAEAGTAANCAESPLCECSAAVSALPEHQLTLAAGRYEDGLQLTLDG